MANMPAAASIRLIFFILLEGMRIFQMVQSIIIHPLPMLCTVTLCPVVSVLGVMPSMASVNVKVRPELLPVAAWEIVADVRFAETT